MRRLVAILLALALLPWLASNSAAADPEYGGDQFHELDLSFYGDLDNGDGSFNTTAPTADVDNATESDCPQSANERGSMTNPSGPRNWEAVGTWRGYAFDTNVSTQGTITFDIWAREVTGGAVDDVQFRATVSLPSRGAPHNDPQTIEITTNEASVAGELVRFYGEGSITNQKLMNQDQRISIDIEYSGGDENTGPLGGSDDQIVIVTSSVDTLAGISLEMDHYRTTFPFITVDTGDQVMEVQARVWSGFGFDDIALDSWDLEIRPGSTDTEPTTIDEAIVLEDEADGSSYLLKWLWHYNADDAKSDAYYLTVTVDDIQDNEWECSREEPIYMVVHDLEVDNFIDNDDLRINNQTGLSKVRVGKSFTVDITIHADGDPAITFNPVPIRVYWIDDGEPVLLFDDYEIVPPGQERTVSFRHTFDDTGEYLLQVILDEDNDFEENFGDNPEGNNLAEIVLKVVEEEDKNWIETFIDDFEEGGTVRNLTVMVMVLTAGIIGGFIVMRRRRVEIDEGDWDDDF